MALGVDELNVNAASILEVKAKIQAIEFLMSDLL